MAAQNLVDAAGESGEDFAEHERTYRFFIKLVRWSLAVIVVILILMAIFLT